MRSNMPIHAAPCRAGSRLHIAGRFADAVSFALEHPQARVHLFETDWPSVDCSRAALEALGLMERIHVWHVAASSAIRRVIADAPAGRERDVGLIDK